MHLHAKRSWIAFSRNLMTILKIRLKKPLFRIQPTIQMTIRSMKPSACNPPANIIALALLHNRNRLLILIGIGNEDLAIISASAGGPILCQVKRSGIETTTNGRGGVE